MKLLSPQSIHIPFAATIPFQYEIKDYLGIAVPRVFFNLILFDNLGETPSLNFKFGTVIPIEQQLQDFFGTV